MNGKSYETRRIIRTIRNNVYKVREEKYKDFDLLYAIQLKKYCKTKKQ
jgi:hypothetical protein